MTKLPKVDGKYGAPMGRTEKRLEWKGGSVYNPASLIVPVKLAMWRVKLNSDGYDSGGAYWGTGQPLYCVECHETGYCVFRRAAARQQLKDAMRREWPDVRFYR